MKYYTESISPTLAEKLKEKGMPMEESRYGIFPHFVAKDGVMYFPPTFASTFDWLMSERGLHIIVEPHWDFANEEITDEWDYNIVKVRTFSSQPKTTISQYDTWHEAAEAAIEKALTLI